MLCRHSGIWRVALCASLFMLAPLAAARGEPQRPAAPEAVAAPTAGDDGANAQLRFQAGSAAYEAGDFTTAIQEWKAAQLLRPAPLLDFNIGLAYERLGRPRAACKYYLQYFAQVPNAPERAEIEARLQCRDARAVTQPGVVASQASVAPGAPVVPGVAPVGPTVVTAAPQVAVPTAPPGGVYAPPPIRAYGGGYGAYPGAQPYVAGAPRRGAAPHVVVSQTKVRKSRWWIVFPVLAGAAATVGIVALVAGASSNSHPRSRPDIFDLTSLPSIPPQGGAPLVRF